MSCACETPHDGRCRRRRHQGRAAAPRAALQLPRSAPYRALRAATSSLRVIGGILRRDDHAHLERAPASSAPRSAAWSAGRGVRRRGPIHRGSVGSASSRTLRGSGGRERCIGEHARQRSAPWRASSVDCAVHGLPANSTPSKPPSAAIPGTRPPLESPSAAISGTRSPPESPPAVIRGTRARPWRATA